MADEEKFHSDTKLLIEVIVKEDKRKSFESHLQGYDYRGWGKANNPSTGVFVFIEKNKLYDVVLSYSNGSYIGTVRPTENNEKSAIDSVAEYNSIVEDFCIMYLDEFKKDYPEDEIKYEVK